MPYRLATAQWMGKTPALNQRLASYPQRLVLRQLAPLRRRGHRAQAGNTRSRCCRPRPNTALRSR